MMKEKSYWKLFCSKIDAVLKDTLDRDIIIFGSNPGGEFIRWYYKYFYQKEVVAVVDRWNSDHHFLVHHLMSLYYLWTEDAVIINTLPDGKGRRRSSAILGKCGRGPNGRRIRSFRYMGNFIKRAAKTDLLHFMTGWRRNTPWMFLHPFAGEMSRGKRRTDIIPRISG